MSVGQYYSVAQLRVIAAVLIAGEPRDQFEECRVFRFRCDRFSRGVERLGRPPQFLQCQALQIVRSRMVRHLFCNSTEKHLTGSFPQRGIAEHIFIQLRSDVGHPRDRSPPSLPTQVVEDGSAQAVLCQCTDKESDHVGFD